tara:strand:- start:4088 stop:4390 length:303 start_codon:yes stop_codon:yes gene_type:complete
MAKFLKFTTATGKERLLNIEACDIVMLKDADIIEVFPVPFDNSAVEFNILRVGALSVPFDGPLVDIINDAIIEAEQSSYTNAVVDVNIPSKYAIADIILA